MSASMSVIGGTADVKVKGLLALLTNCDIGQSTHVAIAKPVLAPHRLRSGAVAPWGRLTNSGDISEKEPLPKFSKQIFAYYSPQLAVCA
jgi:hypothetical protein